jgi:hypothetical protein
VPVRLWLGVLLAGCREARKLDSRQRCGLDISVGCLLLTIRGGPTRLRNRQRHVMKRLEIGIGANFREQLR